jgi:outer membrane autotransporter protein
MFKIIIISSLGIKNIVRLLLLLTLFVNPLYAVQIEFTSDKKELIKGDKFTLSVRFIAEEQDKDCHLFAYNYIKNTDSRGHPTFFESWLNAGDLKFESVSGSWLYVSPSNGDSLESTMVFSVPKNNTFNLIANLKTYNGSELGLPDLYRSSKRCKVSNIIRTVNISVNKELLASKEKPPIFAEPEKVRALDCQKLKESVGISSTVNDDSIIEKLSGKSKQYYITNCKDRGVEGNKIRDRNAEPEEISTQSIAILNTAKKQLGNVRHRLEKLRTTTGKRGIDISGVNVMIQGEKLAIQQLGGAAGDDANDLLEDSRWGMFTNGEYGFGKSTHLDDHRTGSGGRDFDFNTTGLTVGADYRFSNEKMIVGGAIGYKDFNADFTTQEGGTHTKGIHLSAYGTYLISEQSYLDAVIGYGKDQIDSRRPINNDGSIGVDKTTFAIGNPSTQALTFSAGGGYEFNKKEWSLTPYGRMDYTKANIAAYTESSTDPSADASILKFKQQNAESLESTLGIKTSRVISMSKGVLIPHASLEWKHEFTGTGSVVGESAFINDFAHFEESNSNERDKNYYNIGFGMSGVLPKGRSTYLNFESRLGDSIITDNVVKAGFRWEFGVEDSE